MKKLNLLFILCLLFCFKTKAEIIEFADYFGTHLAYELNTNTKEATVGIYKGFSDGNPSSTAVCIHWEDFNNYSDYFNNLVIPNTVTYNGVTYIITALAPYAFCERVDIKTITLPETIKNIGSYAFYFCTNLTAINIPNSVTAINNNTFELCRKLKLNKLGENITTIGSRAFFDCHSITELNIPRSCKTIDNDAFGWCKGLKKLIIEDGNTTLSLGYNYSLSWDYQGQDEAEFRGAFADSPIEDLYLGRNVSFPNGTTKSFPPFTGISNYCTNTTGYQGPNGKNFSNLQFGEFVTNLPNQLFYKSSIYCDIILPPNVETIGDGCFNLSFHSEQIQITFPATLKSVGNNWFNTSNHNKISFIICEGNVPASGNFNYYVVYVPSGAGDSYRKSENWKNCCIVDPTDEIITINVKKEGTLYSRLLAQEIQTNEVNRLKLKGSLNTDDWQIVQEMTYMYELDLSEITNESIPSGFFQNRTYLTKVTLPKTLTSISDNMFSGCSHLNCIIELPKGCNKIGDRAFMSTPIKGFIYTDNIEIGKEAFRHCMNLDTIHIHGIDSKIGYQAFWGSSINKVRIGKGVHIDDEAFYYNQKLEEVILEDSVKYLGSLVFDQCEKFTNLTVEGVVEEITDMKYSYLKTVNIHDISKWTQNSFSDVSLSPLYYAEYFYINGVEPTEIVFSNDTKKIGNYTLYNRKKINKITLPKNCNEIGIAAFYGCSGIESIILSDNINIIGAQAFYGCSNFSDLKLPLSINSIGESAFAMCSGLKSVIAQWSTPITINTNTFSSVSEDCYLYIPILTATQYRNAGWNFPNIKEAGIMKITSNLGGNVEYNKELISNTSKEFLFTPYKSFYINFVPKEGYSIKRVKLNGENVTSLLEDNKLYIEEPEENMDISVVFADNNIPTCDANGDGEINVTDVISVTSHILKKDSQQLFDYAADVNEDEIINITDVVLIINNILNIK